jgi:penicillin G amidase
MKIFRTSIALLLCIAWVFITNYKFFPLNSVGGLMTFKSGLMAIPLEEEQEIVTVDSKYHSQIHIDQRGIPHIYSKTEEATAYGLGFMHAKDRYFQMEMMSRMVIGELSALMGEKTYESDKFWKPYEFNRKSKELLEQYKRESPALYNYLLAYAKGVNDYLNNNPSSDPLYNIFNSSPRQWKPEYSLLVSWYMSVNLSFFDYHQERQEILNKLPQEVKRFFFPLHPDDLNTILPSGKTEMHLIADNYQELHSPVQTAKFNKDVGSNNWAINKAKSRNKVQLLANDPHLFLTLPGPFYEAHMVSDKLKIYGYSIPGVPLIVSGHNEHIAWGITNGEWDLMDTYKLKVKDDSLYYYDGNWLPFENKQYTINIRGKGAKTFTQRNTVHGKLLTIEENKNGDYYAQRWYASDKSYSISSLFNMMKARNWSSFSTALKEYDYPPQNFIFSDVNDTIGIVCAGKLPARKKSYAGGILDGSVRLVSYTEPDTLWSTFNPEEQYLFSANQQPVQNEYYFGAHWHKDDFRSNRIHTLLAENNLWDLESFQQMQQDKVDLSYFEFKKLLKKYSVKPKYSKLIEKLKSWDGNMLAQSKQAFLYEIIRKSSEKEAENFARDILKVSQAPSFKYFIKYLNEDEFTIAGAHSKQIMFENILQRTDSLLIHQYGPQWEELDYSQASSLSIYSMSFLPGFGEKIEGFGGNKNTINMNATAHPVFRSLFEMNGKEKIKGYTIMAGGQSGKINSIHYKDQLNYWKDGKYEKTQFSDNPENLENIKTSILIQ